MVSAHPPVTVWYVTTSALEPSAIGLVVSPTERDMVGMSEQFLR